MVSQSRKHIELIVRTLLNQEIIHTETAKSILENVDNYESEVGEVFNKGIGNYLEKAFNYTKPSATSLAIEDYHKEVSTGEIQTDKYKYLFNITRTPKLR